MKQLKIPTIEEYPETIFQALKRLADFPGDIVTVTNLHDPLLGSAIFPAGPPKRLGQRWVRDEFQEGGKYYKYRGEKEDSTTLLYFEGGQYQIKKPLAAMIIADVIRRAMEIEKTSF
jgi:hypothetical protein